MSAGIIEDTEIEAVSGELLPAVTLTEALFVPNGLDRILAHIKAEVSKHTPDISTERGRKEIASLARKVASSKTRIDEYGKEYVAAIKVKTVVVDAERKRSRDILDKLRDDTRQPLTDWENAEKNRVQAHEDALAAIDQLGNIPFGASVEDITTRIDAADAYVTRDWQEFSKRFSMVYDTTMFRLKKLHEETIAQAAAKAELQRLQEEETKRLQAAHETRLKEEAAAKAKSDAEAEAKRQAETVAAKEAKERRLRRELSRLRQRSNRRSVMRRLRRIRPKRTQRRLSLRNGLELLKLNA
jgi:23S rRNA pseudoU1915 N3-methylase RlmH